MLTSLDNKKKQANLFISNVSVIRIPITLLKGSRDYRILSNASIRRSGVSLYAYTRTYSRQL